MNINTRIKKVRDLLLSVSESVYHYNADNKAEKYIVWAEDMQGERQYGDNKEQETTIQGTIDLFTKQEFDPIVDMVHDILNDNGVIAWISAVQYEEETEFIHYTWDFEV